MLQRLIFAQKRHLEQCSARCKFTTSLPLLSRAQHAVKYIKPSPVASSLPNVPLEGTHAQNSTPHRLANHFAELSSLLDRPPTRRRNDRALKYIDRNPPLSEFFSDAKQVTSLAQHLAKSQSPTHASRIIVLAQERGCSLKHAGYESVCFHLASSNQWKLVLQVVELAKKYTGRLTVRLLNWRAHALLDSRQFTLLSQIVDEFREERRRPTRRTFHFILSGHLRNHDLASTKTCLQCMEEMGILPDSTTHALITKQYRAFGPDSPVQRASLESLPSMPGPVATMVLNNLICSSMDIDDNHAILHFLTFFYPKAVSQIRSSLTTDQDIQSPPSRPLHYHLLPDATTFALFIHYASRRGNHHAALPLVEAMSRLNVQPNSSVVVAVLHSLFSSGQAGQALDLFARVCAQTQISEDVYRSFYLQDHQSTSQLLDVSNVGLNTRICNMMLRWVVDKPHHVHIVCQIMHLHQLRWNTTTTDIILLHLKRCKPVRSNILLQTLQRFVSPSTISLRHLHKIYAAVLREEKRSHFGGGWGIYSLRSFIRDFKPFVPASRLSGTSLEFDPVSGLKVPSEPARRLSLMKDIENALPRGLKNDSAMMALRLRRDAARGDIESAEDVFRSLLARGIHPSEYHYSALIEGFALANDFKAAWGVLFSAERAGVKPTVVMYTILISGYARYKHLQGAIGAFTSMLRRGIKPDHAAIDALVAAHFSVGYYSGAKRLLIKLWSFIEPVPETYQKLSLRRLMTLFRASEQAQRKEPVLSGKNWPSVYTAATKGKGHSSERTQSFSTRSRRRLRIYR